MKTPNDGGTGIVVRQETHNKLIQLLAELRRDGKIQDESYPVEQSERSMKAVFYAVESDEDLAVVFAIFVGEWLHRFGPNHHLEQIIGEADKLVAEFDS